MKSKNVIICQKNKIQFHFSSPSKLLGMKIEKAITLNTTLIKQCQEHGLNMTKIDFARYEIHAAKSLQNYFYEIN